VRRGAVASWTWRLRDVTDAVDADDRVARAVARVREPFLQRASFDGRLVNAINGAHLAGPIDQVVGYTTVALHRANPADRAVPAVLEGSSHNLLADAFRTTTGADIAILRGFRFGTHVRPGPITREDLYHYLPIGAQVAVADSVPGRVIWRQLEASLSGAIDADPRKWTGGWFVGVSGLTIDVDAYARPGTRIRSARVNGAPLDTTGARRYAVAGLWFPSEANAVSNCVPCVEAGSAVRVVTSKSGGPEDAVDVVAAYLAGQPDSTVSPAVGRVRLLRPLPPAAYRFAEIQPLHGAGARPDLPGHAGQTPPPARH
jgi:hypothetical protein